MTERYLTITLQPDWKGALRALGQAAKADTYQGDVLNFESPAHFFGKLSEKRWEIVRAAQDLLAPTKETSRITNGGCYVSIMAFCFANS